MNRKECKQSKNVFVQIYEICSVSELFWLTVHTPALKIPINFYIEVSKLEKKRANSKITIHLSNRPHFLSIYQQINKHKMFGEHKKVYKLESGSKQFPNFSGKNYMYVRH